MSGTAKLTLGAPFLLLLGCATRDAAKFVSPAPSRTPSITSRSIKDQRNVLLGRAARNIRKNLWQLGEDYPQLRLRAEHNAGDKGLDGNFDGEPQPTDGIVIWLPPRASKHRLAVSLSAEKMYGVMVYIKPTGYQCGSGFRMFNLFPNLGLVGQVNTSAADKELDAKLKKLVHDALAPLKELEAATGKR